WGIALIAWTIVVIIVDHVLRPVLIKRGADLPLLLIFAGVVGGLIAFGIIGLFIGPLVLAVAYTLVAAWVARDPAAEAPAPAIPREPAWRSHRDHEREGAPHGSTDTGDPAVGAGRGLLDRLDVERRPQGAAAARARPGGRPLRESLHPHHR